MSSREQTIDTIFENIGTPYNLGSGFEKLGEQKLLNKSNERDCICYLAASQLVHLMEGWANFSSAIANLFYGNFEQCLHLAYYAELRAAMSVIASLGINVQVDDNFYLNKNQKRVTVDLGKKTHEVVWKLWKKYLSTSIPQRLLEQEVRFMPGINLGMFFPFLIYVNVQKELEGWSKDFLLIENDQIARNQASYSIHTAKIPPQNFSQKEFEVVLEIWRQLLRNGSISCFEVELSKTFIFSRSSSNKLASSKTLKELATLLSETSGEDEEMIIRNLEAPSNRLLLDYARSEKIEVLNVLCRAFFLSQFATLVFRRSIYQTDFKRDWLKLWFISHGYKKSLFNEDLIDDIEQIWGEAKSLNKNDFDPQMLWEPDMINSSMLLARPATSLIWGLIQ